jgi:hypothetical protein
LAYCYFNQYQNKFEIYIIDIIEYWVVILETFFIIIYSVQSSLYIYVIPIACLSCKIYLKIGWRLYQQNSNRIWLIYLFKQQSIQAYYIVYYLSKAPCRNHKRLRILQENDKNSLHIKKAKYKSLHKKKKHEHFHRTWKTKWFFFLTRISVLYT